MQNQDNVKSTLKSIQLDNLKNKYSFYFKNKKHFQSSCIFKNIFPQKSSINLIVY